MLQTGAKNSHLSTIFCGKKLMIALKSQLSMTEFLLQHHKASDALRVRVWSYEADVIEAKRQPVRLKARQWGQKLESNNWSKNSDNVREALGVMVRDSKREENKKNQHSSACYKSKILGCRANSRFS